MKRKVYLVLMLLSALFIFNACSSESENSTNAVVKVIEKSRLIKIIQLL